MERQTQIFIIVQVALFFILLFIFRKKIKSFTVLFSVISWVLVPFSFLFGIFFGSINGNICYSNVISELKVASRVAVVSSDEVLRHKYAQKLDRIIVSGYESQCEKIKSSVSDAYELVISEDGNKNQR